MEQVFKEVRIAVTRETQDKQIPWESSSLMGDFYFVPPVKAAQEAVTTQAAQSDAMTAHKPAAAVVAPVVTTVPAKQLKATQSIRDYNREGYEIELRAKNLTIDEVPAMQAAAERGDVVAQTTLGWAYLLGKGQLDGRGIVRSNTKMLSWMRAAAKQGYPVAQNNLGAIYMDGTGVKLDYKKASEYFKLAADQGYLTAKGNLLHVSMLLGKGDSGMLKDMFESVQKQLREPVK
jgi:TPR repeat protein